MIYQEKLNLNHPLIWIILLPIIAFLGYGIVQQLVIGQPFGQNPAPDFLLLFFFILPLGLLIALVNARLHYQLDEQGIRYQFFPFHLGKYQLKWEDVDEVYVRRYKALKEFGGWGIRTNLSNHKAYNVPGDKGMCLEVVKKSGKKIVFSTQNPQQLRQYLDSLSHKGKPH